MKKKITAIIICVLLLGALSLSAFATNDDAWNSSFGKDYDLFDKSVGSEIYEVDEDGEIVDIYDSPYTADDILENKWLFVIFALSVLSEVLFVPALIVMIVFIVLNNKAKKQIKKYESIMFRGTNTQAFGGNYQNGYDPTQGCNPTQGYNNQAQSYNPAQGVNNPQPNVNTAPQGFTTAPAQEASAPETSAPARKFVDASVLDEAVEDVTKSDATQTPEDVKPQNVPDTAEGGNENA